MRFRRMTSTDSILPNDAKYAYTSLRSKLLDTYKSLRPKMSDTSKPDMCGYLIYLDGLSSVYGMEVDNQMPIVMGFEV